jgi:glycosyltransferase involved in cell wall biosynthesis
MRILVAGIPANPFEHNYRIHYSIFKSYGAATGFAELGHKVFFMSKNMKEERDGLILKPYAEMDIDFIKSIDIVIFGLETGVEKVINASKGLLWAEKEKLKGRKNDVPLFIVKQGKHTWMKKSRWGYKDGYRLFDYFFSQEPEFAQFFKNDVGDSLNKIYYSQMGVFKDMPKKQAKTPFKRYKYNLLYMGRMRQSPSRMPFMMEMMDRLGPDFHLNVLPGTFSKPKELLDKLNAKEANKFGAQVEENYQWLVDYFSICPNITVHRPAQWGDHWQYLYHSHLGIDFSPHWKNSKYPAGNAKLLEYMAAGLPSITEASVGNSELVSQANGGIIVPNTGNMNQYCAAIKKALSMKWDRNRISKITIRNNSWEVRAKEMIKFMEK